MESEEIAGISTLCFLLFLCVALRIPNPQFLPLRKDRTRFICLRRGISLSREIATFRGPGAAAVPRPDGGGGPAKSSPLLKIFSGRM